METSPFRSKIKIFADTSERKAMLELNSLPQVAGFTTNPSLMRKAGVTEYKKFCQELLTQIPNKPISFEVFSDELEGMEAQAQQIKTWGKNVFVKIPVMNTKQQSTAPLITKLTKAGVNLNVTAIFTLEQVKEVCAALKGGAPSFVSVFAGRIADTGRDPLPLMFESLKICQATGPQVELLWASCREFYNIVQAEVMGCPIITAPPDVIKKLSQLNRDPYELSVETIKTFKADAESAGFQL